MLHFVSALATWCKPQGSKKLELALLFAFFFFICFPSPSSLRYGVCTCSFHHQFHLVMDWLISPDGKLGNSAELFEKVSRNVKVKRYSEALDDLNAAIEADPKLSEAYFHRGSILRQLCRFSPLLLIYWISLQIMHRVERYSEILTPPSYCLWEFWGLEIRNLGLSLN